MIYFFLILYDLDDLIQSITLSCSFVVFKMPLKLIICSCKGLKCVLCANNATQGTLPCLEGPCTHLNLNK